MGYWFLLMVLDVFSKYGWIELLKDKKGQIVMLVFEKIFEMVDNYNFCGLIRGKSFIISI